MASPLVFSLSLLSLFLVSLAEIHLPQHRLRAKSSCQIQQLFAREPTQRFDYEAGSVELYDSNNQEFECAAVEFVRHTIHPKGLLLPSYANSHRLVYIIQGRGILGTVIPGCAETYESGSERSQGDERRSEADRHQKLRRFQQGDILALQSGITHWTYNDGDTPIVSVSIRDVGNEDNQLDLKFRDFFLAGKPQPSQGRTRRGVEKRNIFSGFAAEFLAEAFNNNLETVRKIQGKDDNRGAIVRAENLKLVFPEYDQQEQERERKQGQQEQESEAQKEQEREEEQGRPGQQEQEREAPKEQEREQEREQEEGQHKQEQEQESEQEREARQEKEREREQGQQEQESEARKEQEREARKEQEREQEREQEEGQHQQEQESEQEREARQEKEREREQGQQQQESEAQKEQEREEEQGRPGQQEQEREAPKEQERETRKEQEQEERQHQQEQEQEHESEQEREARQEREGESEQEREARKEQEREQEGSSESNGLEETICTYRIRQNIDNPKKADLYNPRAGRITRLNSQKLPILNNLRLNADRGVLYKNALMAPYWSMNSHTLLYVIRGSARIQVVGNQGNTVFDDEAREGQLLVVPQNFAVVKRAKEEGFEWVAFRTNDNAMIGQLAGRLSAIRAMPEEVVMNAFGVSREEARSLKFNREETTLLSPATRSASA